ncbi:hypothetical protein Mapa_017142 [Marchantia paleacea]|nr:hypothetical protein Mapa_017142 [Marchantia paleacea]
MSSKKRKQRADEGQGQADVPDVPPPPVLDFPAAGSRESLGGQSQTRVRRSSRSGARQLGVRVNPHKEPLIMLGGHSKSSLQVH